MNNIDRYTEIANFLAKQEIKFYEKDQDYYFDYSHNNNSSIPNKEFLFFYDKYYLETSPCELIEGEHYRCIIDKQYRVLGKKYFYRDWEDFLWIKNNFTAEFLDTGNTKPFFLLSENTLYRTGSNDDKFIQYCRLLQLIKTLKNCCDLIYDRDMLFVKDNRITEIRVGFHGDFLDCNLPNINQIIESLPTKSQIHEFQKKLNTLLKDTPKENRFLHLLQNVQELANK